MKKNTKIILGVAAAVVIVLMVILYRRRKAQKAKPAPLSLALVKEVTRLQENPGAADLGVVAPGADLNAVIGAGETGGVMPDGLANLNAADIMKINNTNTGNIVANVAPLSVTVPITPRGGYVDGVVRGF